jgi:hypothetical protein
MFSESTYIHSYLSAKIVHQYNYILNNSWEPGAPWVGHDAIMPLMVQNM